MASPNLFPVSSSSSSNDTDWVAATFATLVMTGLGTITNNLQMRRQGGNLKIRGGFSFGTITSSAAQLLLPTFNGSQLVSAASPIVTQLSSVGSLFRDAAATSTFVNVMTNTSRNYLSFSNFLIVAGNNPLTEVSNTSALFGSGYVWTINGELTIPITGWTV